MGERKRTIIVHAFDKEGTRDEIDFKMSGYGVQQDVIRCSKDRPRPKMKKSEHHTVIFELANRSSVEDLRFPSNPDDAMWVAAEGADCPQAPCHQKEVVFATHVSPDREQLTVKNHNKEEKSFRFALVFRGTQDGETKRFLFDPIWANNNGGDED